MAVCVSYSTPTAHTAPCAQAAAARPRRMSALPKPEMPRAHVTGQQERVTWRSPTRDQNFDFERWALHKGPGRHFRHLAILPVSTALWRLVIPDLAILTVASTSITYYNEVLVPAGQGFAWLFGGAMLSLPAEPLTLTGMALGLLVTFRTNASHHRFSEARALWGEVINASRDLTRQALQYMPARAASSAATAQRAVDGTETSLASPALADLVSKDAQEVVRLVKAFPIVLRFHLTKDGGYHGERWEPVGPGHGKAQRRAHGVLHGELAALFDCDDPAQDAELEECLAAPHRPLWVLQRLGGVLAARQRPSPSATIVEALQFDRLSRETETELQRLTAALGGCERLLRTPIPTSFTRHASRALMLWCYASPLVLYPVMGVGTPVAAFFVAWALLGLEDIGVQVEEPFDVLPLLQICQAVHDSCDNLVGAATSDAARRGVPSAEQQKQRAPTFDVSD